MVTAEIVAITSPIVTQDRKTSASVTSPVTVFALTKRAPTVVTPITQHATDI